MVVSERDLDLLRSLQRGLPLVSRPYAELGRIAGMSESEVLWRLAALREAGIVRRLGVIVRHRELGYRANAMLVWALPEERVAEVGAQAATLPFVSLCYRRRPQPPQWPYNLYCMVHGRDRDTVLAQRDELIAHCALADVPHEALFSRRRFKQRGAWYFPQEQAS
jgi:siroheme decarboxylase